MFNQDWILIDTETTGFNSPIFVVDLAAQRMSGWSPVGPSFRRMINHGVDIPPEASRVNGYTREILERDGEDPIDVYGAFAEYTGDLPICAYNLEYDLHKVLLPEWDRLGITAIGHEGFCVLKLAQRLLDPVPAGNCKLQTLRQYYRMPERGAHTAIGDVETVVDLLDQVLGPMAERQGLNSLEDIHDYLAEDWFPSRITFGKFKGVDFRDARDDNALHEWLVWLTKSNNSRIAKMGRWYLKHHDDDGDSDIVVSGLDGKKTVQGSQTGSGDIVVYQDPELDELRQLVAAARERLAGVESEYTQERNAVDVVQNKLFLLLRGKYQKRDILILRRDCQKKYLDSLLTMGEEEAEQVYEEYERAKSEQDKNYQEAEQAAENTKALSKDQQSELKKVWKKLVRLYHPDRYNNDPEKYETYTQITSLINHARDEGDIELLEEIARDPEEFMLKQGWTAIDFSDEKEVGKLRKLYAALQHEILTILEALNQLRDSAEYDLMKLSRKAEDYIQIMSEELGKQLDSEIADLRAEINQLDEEIDMLEGGIC